MFCFHNSPVDENQIAWLYRNISFTIHFEIRDMTTTLVRISGLDQGGWMDFEIPKVNVISSNSMGT